MGLEYKVDLAYTYLLKLARSKNLDNIQSERIKRRVNFLKAKLGSYDHQLAEELYNTLDAVMLVAKVYGEGAAWKEAGRLSYDIRPLLDILTKDAKEIEYRDGEDIYEIYQKVKRSNTTFGKLYRELQPYSKILQEWKKCKEEILVKELSSKKIYDFKTGILREKRRAYRLSSIPFIVSGFALISLSPFYILLESLYLSSFYGGYEGMTRLLEKSRKVQLKHKSLEKLMKSINLFEMNLRKVGWSLPYLLLLGARATLFGIDYLIAYMPMLLTWTWGVPLGIYIWQRIKPAKNKMKAYMKVLVKEKKLRGIKEKVREYIQIYQARENLEEPPDPTKKGLLRKINRFLSTWKLPVGKKKYIDFLELPFIIKRRRDLRELEEIKSIVVDELKKDYSSEIVEIVEKDYLPFVKLGEDKLNQAIGIKPTTTAATLYVYKENARKLGEENYHLGEPKFLKYITEEIIRQREEAGMNILVRKKVDKNWVEASYTPEIFDYKDDFQIVASKNGKEELILGVEYKKKNREEKTSIGKSIVSKISKKLMKKLYEEKVISSCSGSSVGYLERVAKEGLITQVPRVSEKGISYALEEYEIYLTDLNTKEGLLLDLMHEAKHIANNIEAWEETKQLEKVLTKELFIEKQT